MMTKPVQPTPAPTPGAAAARFEATSDALAKAEERKAILDKERAETEDVLHRAEEEVRLASVSMANSPGDKVAVEAFHKATRHQTEIKARLEAFDEHVIPSAVHTLEQLQRATATARSEANVEKFSEYAAEYLGPADQRFKELMSLALDAYRECVAVRQTMLTDLTTHSLPRFYADQLGDRLLIPKMAAMVPQEILQLGVNQANSARGEATLYAAEGDPSVQAPIR